MSEIIPAQRGIVAFGRSNASEERIRKAQEELESLKNPQSEQKQDEGVDPSLPAEEQTFKKRYGDLRRHSQKQQEELQKQIDQLRTQLETATKKEIRLPKSEEEIEAWAQQFPDVHKIIETIAIKKAREQTSTVEQRMKQIDEMEKRVAREKAEAELMRLHPDFDSIRDQDDFHEWAEEQPKWVQDALYNNDTDARSAARAIDLYKADKGIRTNKSSTSNRDAAMSVSSKASPSKNVNEGAIYESEVAKMSMREYEAKAAEIQKAMQTGKFVYDLSGNAR